MLIQQSTNLDKYPRLRSKGERRVRPDEWTTCLIVNGNSREVLASLFAIGFARVYFLCHRHQRFKLMLRLLVLPNYGLLRMLGRRKPNIAVTT